MSARTIIAVLVFIGLLILVSTTLFKPQERNLSRLSAPSIVPETVEKIVVSLDETFELLKEGEHWLLGDGRPADPDMIDRALESVEGLTSTGLISSNPEQHATYEVDEEKGQRVTLFVQDQPVLDFVIGKSSSVGGTYLRLAETDDVYLVQRSPIKSYFAPTESQWQRLKLFDAEISEVVSLTVASGAGSEFVLVQGEEKKWALSDMSLLPVDFRFDETKARSLVSAFLNLRAKEILTMSPDPTTSGLGAPGGMDTYSLTLTGGATHILGLGKLDADEQHNYAQLDGEQYFYLPSFSADNIRKDLNDFRALNLMEFDPDAVKKFSIKTGNVQRIFEKVGEQWAVANASAQPPADFVLNGSTVERSLQELSRVRAKSYVGDASVGAGFGDPSFEVEVTLDSDDVVTLRLGTELQDGAQTAYYAQGNADAGTYLVQEHEVAQLTASGFDRWK